MLMHKDAEVYDFNSGVMLRGDLIPCIYGTDISNLKSELFNWMRNRLTPTQRVNTDLIYKQLKSKGALSMEDMLIKTYSISINDNYWIRGIEHRHSWEHINLFSNNQLDENISKMALIGCETTQTQISNTISPEYTGQGTYAKCISREKMGLVLYKVGTELEMIVEELVYKVAQVLNIRTARYYRTNKFGIDVIASPILTDQSVSWISAFDSTRFFEQYYSMNVYEFATKYFPMQFYQMVVLDGLVLNPDRHLKNWSFELNGDTNSLIGLAPLYDYNRAFTGDKRDMSREIPGVNILEAARLAFPKSDIQFDSMQMLVSLTDSIPEKYRDKFFNRMLYIIGRRSTQDNCY